MDIEAIDPIKVGVGRAAAWLSKQLELALCEVDLSLPQYRVLSLLDEGSAISSAIAERLAVRPPSITAVVDGLVSRGLVDREAVPDDRRRISLVLTEEGRRLLGEADGAAGGRLSRIAGCLDSDEETALAIENLQLWHEALVKYHVAKMVTK